MRPASPTGCSRPICGSNASAACRITGLPCKENELFGDVAAEAGASAGGDENRGDFHAAQM